MSGVKATRKHIKRSKPKRVGSAPVFVPHPDDAADVREAFAAVERGEVLSAEESAARSSGVPWVTRVDATKVERINKLVSEIHALQKRLADYRTLRDVMLPVMKKLGHPTGGKDLVVAQEIGRINGWVFSLLHEIQTKCVELLKECGVQW